MMRWSILTILFAAVAMMAGNVWAVSASLTSLSPTSFDIPGGGTVNLTFSISYSGLTDGCIYVSIRDGDGDLINAMAVRDYPAYSGSGTAGPYGYSAYISSSCPSPFHFCVGWDNDDADGGYHWIPPDDEADWTSLDCELLTINLCEAPSIPTGMTTLNITENSAELYWNSMAEADSYFFYLNSTGDPTTPGATEGLAVADTELGWMGLDPCTIHYWWVRAYANCGESSNWCARQEFTTLGCGSCGQWVSQIGNDSERQCPGMSVVAGSLFVFGGWRPGGAINTMVKVALTDLPGGSFTSAPNMSEAKFQFAWEVVGNVIYVFGGQSMSEVFSSCHKYTPGSGWSSLPSLPVPICDNDCAYLDGKIYVIGGIHNQSPPFEFCDSVFVFDVSGENWDSPIPYTPTDKMDPTRMGFRCATIGSEIFVMGGGNPALSPSDCDNVQAFRPSSPHWVNRPALNVPRVDFDAVSTNGAIYVIGGHRGTGSPSPNDIHEVYWDGAWYIWEATPTKSFTHNAATIDSYGDIYARSEEAAENVYKLIPCSTPVEIEYKESLPAILKITTYPNPFNSCVSIVASDKAGIEIFNLNGKCIGAFDKTPCVWTPDEKITSGIYLIRATFGEKTITKRAILMK